MKIAILWAYGAYNLWDELILKNMIPLLQERFWEKSEFYIFSYAPKDPFITWPHLHYLPYFPDGLKDIRNIWKNIWSYFLFHKTLKNMDHIVIGGGGIFFEGEVSGVSDPLIQRSWRVKQIQKYKKPYTLYGVSIDVVSQKGRSSIKEIFQYAQDIYVRDDASQKLLTSLWITAQKVYDPVFLDDGDIDASIVSQPYLQKYLTPREVGVSDFKEYDWKDKNVWLALRSGYIPDEKRFIQELITFLQASHAHITLLPHSFHPKQDSSNDLLFLQDFVWERISLTKNMQETYDFYKKNIPTTIIAMRLHAGILSHVYKKDFFMIGYAGKSEIFLQKKS